MLSRCARKQVEHSENLIRSSLLLLLLCWCFSSARPGGRLIDNSYLLLTRPGVAISVAGVGPGQAAAAPCVSFLLALHW